MSHIVEIKTQIRDAAAVVAACRRLDLAEPMERTVKIYTATATGLVVELPGWLYPIVCDCARGTLQYDNFEGRWGEQAQLDRFLQAYAIEKARLEARKAGHSVTEQELQDGSVKLTIQVAGGAA